MGNKSVEDVCEFWPDVREETCICGAGSDVSGESPCTRKYSEFCRWAEQTRKERRGV